MDMIGVMLLNRQTTEQLKVSRQQLQDGIDSRVRGIEQIDYVLAARSDE